MPGKNEQVSLDMFLEVENMALDCEICLLCLLLGHILLGRLVE